jgi:hypothetical protein
VVTDTRASGNKCLFPRELRNRIKFFEALLKVQHQPALTRGVNHVVGCNAAATILKAIKVIQNNPRRSLAGRELESRSVFGAGSRKPMMRESSLWAGPWPLPAEPRFTALPTSRRETRALRRPMDVQSRLAKFRRTLKEGLSGRRVWRLMFP